MQATSGELQAKACIAASSQLQLIPRLYCSDALHVQYYLMVVD